nr:putative ribonuclease H-like domain-containing protein [Tanacetum cinerariifolium]
VHNETTNTQQQPNIQPQIITIVSNNNAKVPYLKKDEYEVWAIKMECWIKNNDMNIWKVIQNGNSMKRTGRDRDGRVSILPPTTTEEHIVVQMESKARTTLLQSIPDDHVVDFHYIDDARDIWNAVKARFGGNAESKKMRKSMLKQEFSKFRIGEAEGLHKGYDRMQKILSQLNQLKAKPEDEDINLKFLRALPSSWSHVALTLKTKGRLELLSFDDLYYKLKTLEVDVKGYTTFSLSQSAGTSHSAFFNAISASKKMSYGDKKMDLEEMDLKWKMAMLSVRVHKFKQKAGRKIDFDKKESARFNKKKVKFYKCQQRAHFTRECKAKGGNDKQRYSSFKIKEIGKKEEDSKALITVDTLVDWTDHDGAAKIYNLITRANTKEAITAGDAGEFALMGVISERSTQMTLPPVILVSNLQSPSQMILPPVHQLLVGTHIIKDCNFYEKQMANKSVGIGVGPVHSRNKVNHQNQFVSQAVLLRTGKVNIPSARPQLVPTGKPKVFASVPTGWPNRPFPVPTDKGYSPSEIPFSAAEDEGIFDSGCSRSMTDTECLVLSKDFKFSDESIVVLRVPRKYNIYTINLNNLCPRGNLACLVAHALVDESVKWHRRMGHVNYKNMNRLAKRNLVRGLPYKLFKNDHTCVTCCKDKQHKASYKAIDVVSLISEPLQLLHMDLFGPTSIRSIDHKYYCLVITDDYSRFCWVFFLEHKYETYPILKDFINLVENQLNKKVKAIRCDNGTEFKNALIIELCGSKEIKRKYSNARTHSKIRVSITRPHNKTPYALLTGNIPSVSHFKPFGCHVTILNTSNHLGKFDGKADEGYIVGYFANSDCGEQVIIIPSYPSHNIPRSEPKDTSGDEVDDSPLHSADEIFQKELARLKGQAHRATSDAESLGLGFVNDAVELQSQASVKTVTPGCIPVPAGNVLVPPGSIPVPTGSIPVPTSSPVISIDNVPVHTSSSTDSFFDDEPTTRFPSPPDLGNHDSSPGIFSSSSYDDKFGAALNNVASTVEVNPLRPWKIQAGLMLCRKKCNSLSFRMYGFLLICQDKYAIGTKWMLKNKRDARGIVVRNKARLIAQGHRQEEGIDYNEVFAHVARIEAIRLLLAFASYMGFMVYQMDVKSMFLYGRIDEEVYVTQPKGFVDPQHPKKVYKVVKALYGLLQAPRAWYATLSTFLLKHGYRRGTIDKTFFLKKNNRDIILVQVYVDDIIFGSTKKAWCDEFKALMKGEFQMSAMRELTFFLASRPDIMFAVSACSRNQVTPTTSNLEAVKKIFKYLKGQPKLGLWYPKESPLVFEAYSDSDYAGANKDKKSTTGGCQFLGRRLISWQCKK